MAQDSIVGGLFGLTPEMYQRSQQAADQQEATQFAQLTPFQQASAGFYSAGRGLGRGIGSMLGAEDPQLKEIAAIQSVSKNIDFSDPLSIKAGVEQLSNVSPAAAMNLAKFGQDLLFKQSEIAKNLQAPKLTGDERYIQILQAAENLALQGKEIPPSLLSQANMSAQLLAKNRTYFDSASGQTVTQPGTDPSKAFPNVFKLFGEQAPETKPGVTQATEGNLPQTSQKRLGEISGSLEKLSQSQIDLTGFVQSLEKGDVKYNATSNAFDFLGAIVPPAFGFKEQGNQVKKDEINRSLKERVNTVLLQAKGTQTEGDAKRASDLIADPTTYLSQERMDGAINALIKAENKLKNELLAEQNTLLNRGRQEPEKRTQQPQKSVAAKPTLQQKAQQEPTVQSDAEKIRIFIQHNTKNGVGPSEEEARKFLRSRNLLRGD
jgi:hypothetical protein